MTSQSSLLLTNKIQISSSDGDPRHSNKGGAPHTGKCSAFENSPDLSDFFFFPIVDQVHLLFTEERRGLFFNRKAATAPSLQRLCPPHLDGAVYGATNKPVAIQI